MASPRPVSFSDEAARSLAASSSFCFAPPSWSDTDCADPSKLAAAPSSFAALSPSEATAAATSACSRSMPGRMSVSKFVDSPLTLCCASAASCFTSSCLPCASALPASMSEAAPVRPSRRRSCCAMDACTWEMSSSTVGW